ncbi:MAG TPA: OmpW family outer membrane protein [Myxococcales bacterium]
MTRLAATVFASALCLAALAPSAAQAIPPENTTRLGIQAGWRYQPNARFLEWAAAGGHASTGALTGGPALQLSFGYRPLTEIEVSIELGYAFEQFGFAGEKAMQLHQLPLTLAARYSPFAFSSFYPYVGLGYGYLLNFFQDAPGGAVESHGQGPVGILGAVFEVSKTVSMFVEYRYTYCRVEIQNLGYMQTGGNGFFLGVQVGFPPEDNRLR